VVIILFFVRRHFGTDICGLMLYGGYIFYISSQGHSYKIYSSVLIYYIAVMSSSLGYSLISPHVM
jgi:hypothetical protein